MNKMTLIRSILALTDGELEVFGRDWIVKKKEYVEVTRFGQTGDLGRDVVGYYTAMRHEGAWDNYQCKQYGRTLPTDRGLADLGKILYYSYLGEFTAPSRYFFVAPRGVNRNLSRYISKPTELKSVLIDEWDKYCSRSIIENKIIELSPELKSFLSKWDFSVVSVLGVDHILDDHASKAVLKQWFDVDPGPAPLGVVPDDIEDREFRYVEQLLAAYSEREKSVLNKASALIHAVHGPHLRRQRERFFDADSFARFYRDNTMQGDIEALRRELHHGVVDVCEAEHQDSLCCVEAVMKQAAAIAPSGALAKHAGPPVRQGFCHQFANEGTLTWRRK